MTSPHRIAIRTVETIGATGVCTERRYVCCPVREESATAEACAACLHRVPGPSDGFALCGAGADEPEKPASWAADRLRVHLLADQTPVTAAVTREVASVHVGDSLDAVGHLLLTREIGGAPVVDDAGRPIGVVSKTDLVRQQHLARGGPETAGHVMTAFVATVLETAPLSHVADLMSSSGIHRVVVVSASGAVVGIVSTLDLLEWLTTPAEGATLPPPFTSMRARIPAARVTVSSLMGARVVCVEPGVTADALATILLDEQISGAPVVEASGVAIGVVSKTDLVESQDAARGAVLLELEDDHGKPVEVSGPTVRELMTRYPISVREHTSVLRAATIMVEQRVHRVPVLASDGRVLGLLTALDVVRWLAAREHQASRKVRDAK